MLKKNFTLPIGTIYFLALGYSYHGGSYIWILVASLIILAIFIIKVKVNKIRIAQIILITLIIATLRGAYCFYSYQSAIKYTGEYVGEVEVVKIMDKAFLGDLKALSNQKVLFYYEEATLKPGDNIWVESGYLKLPQEELNEGGFSYQDYLRNKNIYYLLEIKKSHIKESKRNLDYYLHQYKSWYLEKLKLYIGENTKYIKSIFLGDDSDLSDEDTEHWRNLGVSHLQAVSGAQVGVIIDLIMLLYILVPGKNKVKAIFFILLLFIYGYITSSPSVWRTITFYLINLIVIKNNIEADETSQIIFSGGLLSFINPGLLFNIAFQLSFVVSLGVILYKEKIAFNKKKIIKVLVSGFIALLFTWPILSYWFQTTPLLTVVTTPLIAPIVQLIIFIAGIYFLFPFFIELLSPLNYILNFIIDILNHSISILNHLPILLIHYSNFTVLTIITYYSVLIFYEYLGKIRNKVIIIIFLLIQMVIPEILIHGQNYVEVDFINVGQGDSILIITNKPRKVILIDGGKSYKELNYGEKEIIPFLRRKGIDTIDMVVSTHSDVDHKGGLDAVIKAMNCLNIIIPPEKLDIDNEYLEWRNEYGNKIKEIEKNMMIKIGQVEIQVIAPDGAAEVMDNNETSIVLNLKYGESEILLTGDCSLSILEELVNNNKKIDIIKAPHHGSIKSYKEGIYSNLGARCVVFSVGKNSYGHPGSKIIEDLDSEQIKYYRTDQQKDIKIKLYKNKFIIEGQEYENDV
ncbi:MAG: DNA internalization-related competence protein ComEC/Rec2 [Fusobacteria bacterium]|nr:DNA internalization-related competence protein ComEC/Rec2 [Fusobacteriota bacterium]